MYGAPRLTVVILPHRPRLRCLGNVRPQRKDHRLPANRVFVANTPNERAPPLYPLELVVQMAEPSDIEPESAAIGARLGGKPQPYSAYTRRDLLTL